MTADAFTLFGAPDARAIHVVGAGGKSTLMFALARAFAGAGGRVVTTTTTRIREHEADGAPCVLAPDAEHLLPALRELLGAYPRVTAAATRLAPEGKLAGLPPAVIDALVAARVADRVLVEADGAAGRPLKAHAAHEPVIASCADLVIVVAGMGALGAPLDEAYVHRAALAAERTGLAPGTPLDAAAIARLLAHPAGILAHVPAGARVVAFLNTADTPAAREDARAVAAALRGQPGGARIASILAGSARDGVLEVVG